MFINRIQGAKPLTLDGPFKNQYRIDPDGRTCPRCEVLLEAFNLQWGVETNGPLCPFCVKEIADGEDVPTRVVPRRADNETGDEGTAGTDILGEAEQERLRHVRRFGG